MARRTTSTTRKLQALGAVSLRKLALETGIALPHLSRIFSRKRGLTVGTAQRIARATGRTLDQVADTLAA